MTMSVYVDPLLHLSSSDVDGSRGSIHVPENCLCLFPGTDGCES